MILPREHLLWVRDETGRRAPFDAERLVDSIQSARPPGETTEIAATIAGAIEHFSREHTAEGIVDARALSNSVENLLQILGYGDWAQAYARRHRRAEIRLDEMAARFPTGFELAFYQHLDAALAAAVDEQLRLVQMRGLRACVLRLRGARRWGANCRRLADDILGHVQERVARLRSPAALALELAVMEEA